MHLIERWTRVGPEKMAYVLTVTDPSKFTQPWTVELTLTNLVTPKVVGVAPVSDRLMRLYSLTAASARRGMPAPQGTPVLSYVLGSIGKEHS